MGKGYIIFLLLIYSFAYSQSVNNRPFYLLFKLNESCNNKAEKFNIDFETDQNIKFIIRDCKNNTNEIFVHDKSSQIDSFPSNYSSEVNFITIERMNEINVGERSQVFQNNQFISVFKKRPIYIVRKVGNKFMRYEVNWVNRVLLTTQDDD